MDQSWCGISGAQWPVSTYNLRSLMRAVSSILIDESFLMTYIPSLKAFQTPKLYQLSTRVIVSGFLNSFSRRHSHIRSTSPHPSLPTRKMSSVTPISLSSLKFIKAPALADLLRDPSSASSLAIIDVRDSDHIGGHIRGSQWVPTDQLDLRMPELLRTLKDKDRVVFHCMLSQQRGPKSALQYARARAYVEEKQKKEQGNDGDIGGREDKSDSQKAADLKGGIGGQEVCVLEGGFESWRALYAEDETLTEAYAKDLWD